MKPMHRHILTLQDRVIEVKVFEDHHFTHLVLLTTLPDTPSLEEEIIESWFWPIVAQYEDGRCRHIVDNGHVLTT